MLTNFITEHRDYRTLCFYLSIKLKSGKEVPVWTVKIMVVFCSLVLRWLELPIICVLNF